MYAKVENGIVIEIADEAQDDLWISCGEAVITGWSFNGFTFYPPVPEPDPVPPPAPNAAIDAQIVALEATQTDRRIRDAAADDAGGSTNGRAWLKALNDHIAALRSQRT